MPVTPEGTLAAALYDQPLSPEPEVVQPTSTRPAPSSQTPDIGGTSGEDDESPSAPQDLEIIEFDPRYAEAFVGLLYLGRLEETFTLWGHEFVIRTLTTEEIAEIALIAKPYQDTLAQNAVYAAAVVAACVVTVDGQALPESIVRGDNSLASTKFPYVMKKWFPPVRDGIYQKYFALEVEARRVLAEMGKTSG